MPQRFILISSALLVCLIFSPKKAQAQFDQYLYPVEQAFLDKHVELQFHYTKLDLAISNTAVSMNSAFLSVEGQWAFADRFEVGLNVPFLHYGSTSSGSIPSEAKSEFGDVRLDLKGRIFGLGETLALSVFVDTYLPTHSADYSRDYAIIQPGVAVSAKLLGLLVGGGVQSLLYVYGKGDDSVYVGFNGYAGYSLLGLVSFNLAIDYMNSVKPSSEANAFSVIPGVEVGLFKIVRIGVSSRIAINDDAKLLYLGRASLLFHGGISF
jgi:hypothetical protein